MGALATAQNDGQVLAQENPAVVVWRLAWPAVALNSLQVINQLLDRGFIGHLTVPAMTGHGGAINVMFLMFSLAISVAMGATAIVSRAFGAEDHKEVRHASRESLLLAVWFGIALGLITALGARSMSEFILPRSDHEAIRQMTRFLIAYGLGMPAISVIQTLAGCLRGVGDTKSPMVISGVQILLHITLNVLLIFPTRSVFGVTIPGAGLGLTGAAAALSTSATLAAIGYIVYTRRTPLGKLSPFGVPGGSYVVRIMRVAVPASVQAVLRVFSLTAFTLILGLIPDGSVAIAGMSLAFGIEGIIIMPAFGLSAASGALVGQSLGMKRPDRAEQLGWTAGHHAGLVTLALAIPIFFAAPAIAGAMLPDKPEVLIQGVTLMRLLCLTEVGFAYGVTMQGAMQGAGDTLRPLWIVIITQWGLRVPMALLLAIKPGTPIFLGLVCPIGANMGPLGGWIAMAATQGLGGILSCIFFKQGAWKLKKV